MWADQSGVRAGNSEGERTRDAISITGTKLQEPQANGGELGGGKRVCLGDCITQGEHQPVRGGVQMSRILVGERLRQLVRSEQAALVQFDEVLGLASGRSRAFRRYLGRPVSMAGDDEADVEALCVASDPGAGAAVSVPGFRPIACSAKRAGGLLVERAAGANVVRGLIDQPVERTRFFAREAKRRSRGPFSSHHSMTSGGVMTVASDRDPGLRPSAGGCDGRDGAGDRGSRCPRASCRGAAARRRRLVAVS